MRRMLAVVVLAAVVGLGVAQSPVEAQTAQWRMYALDDEFTFLGVIGGRYDSESICNRFGVYGSRFSSTSIRNRFSQFGSRFSTYSAYNEFTTTPPVIWDGEVSYYVTKNEWLGGIDPDVLLAYIGCPNED